MGTATDSMAAPHADVFLEVDNSVSRFVSVERKHYIRNWRVAARARSVVARGLVPRLRATSGGRAPTLRSRAVSPTPAWTATAGPARTRAPPPPPAPSAP